MLGLRSPADVHRSGRAIELEPELPVAVPDSAKAHTPSSAPAFGVTTENNCQVAPRLCVGCQGSGVMLRLDRNRLSGS
jgi:hypothetical protein